VKVFQGGLRSKQSFLLSQNPVLWLSTALEEVALGVEGGEEIHEALQRELEVEGEGEEDSEVVEGGQFLIVLD